MPKGLRKVFAHEAGLSLLLALLVVQLFVLLPLFAHRPGLRILLDGGLTLVLLVALATTGLHRRLLRVSFLAVGVAVVSLWLRHVVAAPWVDVTFHVGAIVFLGLTVAGLLMRTLAGGHTTVHRISGSIAAYIVIGLIWSFVFSLIELLAPGSFSSVPAEPLDRLRAMFYLSMVTLTTLGYGDITPVAPLSRSLAVVEALVGQLYLVILIARLVAQWLVHSQSEEPPQSRMQS